MYLLQRALRLWSSANCKYSSFDKSTRALWNSFEGFLEVRRSLSVLDLRLRIHLPDHLRPHPHLQCAFQQVTQRGATQNGLSGLIVGMKGSAKQELMWALTRRSYVLLLSRCYLFILATIKATTCPAEVVGFPMLMKVLHSYMLGISLKCESSTLCMATLTMKSSVMENHT
jgi:hypothetical protein